MNLHELMLRCSASPDQRWDICSEIYNALLSGNVQPADLAPYSGTFASFWRDIDEQVRPFQKSFGNSWRSEEDYQDPRNEAVLLLEMFGYVPGEPVVQEMRNALSLSDPLLVMTSALSLLRQRETVAPEALECVAASDETRSRWERSLAELGFAYLFPLEFSDAESRARGRLVEWLIHPTEWECPPDEIELMDRVDELYVFQFRTRPGYHWSSNYGWVAGIAADDLAFSDYQPSAMADPQEHARRMKDITRM